MRYTNLKNTIFQLLNILPGPIKYYPDNFEKIEKNTARVSIVVGDSDIYKNLTGLLIIDIFISANEGPSALYSIADQLDNLMLKKTINGVQFFTSTMSPLGHDVDNPVLFRGRYQLNFTYFLGN